MRLAATFCLLAASASSFAADAPRVSLEIVARKDVSAAVPQQWHEALAPLGFASLRIRSGDGGEKPAIRSEGGVSASYQVVGILADNTLHLPGGKFSLRETARLRAWLDNVRELGVEGARGERAAFGLTPGQFDQVRVDLSQRVGFATRGLAARDAATRIARQLRVPLAVDNGAAAALARTQVEDELDGVSCGTALAAVLRPAGLVLEPRYRRAAGLEYRVGKPLGDAHWPVGWPPEGRAPETLPLLYEQLNVEIAEIPVAEAVAAIGGRLEVPLLYDRSAMALHGVDPAAVHADVPSRRMSYSQALGRVLAQAALRYELRVDENQRPLVWITTVKRAP